jgi:nucleoid DNA-binding protein
VNKADIIDRIASKTGITKLETEAVVNGFLHTVIEAMKEGETIELRGFGTFRVQHRAPRTARNPRTNEELQVPARHVPVFKPSKDFRGEVERVFENGR